MRNSHALASLLLAIAAQNCAAVDLSAHEALRRVSPESFQIHVASLADGMLWANSALAARGERQLFCPPKTLALNTENYIKLIDDEAKRVAKPGDNPQVGLLLLVALSRTFPCN